MGYLHCNSNCFSISITGGKRTCVVVMPYLSSRNSILKHLHLVSSGRTVSSITFPNVTATQALTTSHADITGSNITYTPPAGTTTVVYTFSFNFHSFVIPTHVVPPLNPFEFLSLFMRISTNNLWTALVSSGFGSGL